MTSKLDEELKRLSKAATQEDDDVRYYGGPTSTHRPARDAYHAALVNAYRTGQLVPAQPSVGITERQSETLHKALLASYDSIVLPMPSGDEVEAVARHLCEREILKAYTRPDRADELKEFRKIEVDHLWENYKDLATASITAYEAVSGVAKMREALKYYAKDYDYERGCSQWDGGAFARAALGEKP